jgi:hypothetical protein
VLAEPSKCKIYVDGLFLEYPPITQKKLVAGRHIVKAVLDVDSGQVQEQEIEIPPDGSSEVKFLFKVQTPS